MQPDPYKFIESAESEDDADVKREALCNAIRLLADAEDLSADACYALGYAWYLMPDDTEERRSQIVRHLSAALKKVPNHLYARLYLAHYYFDTLQFALALPILQGFDSEEFATKGQEWRDVKVAELILACLIELNDAPGIPRAVQDLLERASRVDSDAIPVPVELSRVLEQLVHVATK